VNKQFAPDSYRESSLQLTIEDSWNIMETISPTGMHGYRFWTYNLKGEGFFISCFRKEVGGESFSVKAKKKLAAAGKKEQQLVKPWIKENAYELGINNNIIYALPPSVAEEINILLTSLRVQYSGTIVGEIFGDKFVPSHPLAMSPAVSDAIPRTELDYEKAIQYLQKKEFNPGVTTAGWHLINYQGHNLGWAKMLPNRINNYYPKELRILKDI
jgi:NOL1/NOP2/fmu family ribosome biogenesis protein